MMTEDDLRRRAADGEIATGLAAYARWCITPRPVAGDLRPPSAREIHQALARLMREGEESVPPGMPG